MSNTFAVGIVQHTVTPRIPAFHILVQVPRTHQWITWCSGSRAQEASPRGSRLCKGCRNQAREAFDKGHLRPPVVGRQWFTSAQLELYDGRQLSAEQ